MLAHTRALTFALALAGTTLSSGCFALRPGELVGTEPVEGTERVVRESFEYQLAGWPTPSNPVLTFAIDRDQSVTLQRADVHEELRAPRRSLIALGALAGIAGAVMVVTNTEDSDLATVGMIGGLTGASIAFTLFMTRAAPTGETRRGRTYPDSTERAGPLPAGTEMEVRVGDVTRRVAAAEGGQIRIELARDFGLTYFDDPQSMPLTVGPDAERDVVSILIHPSEWTTRCVRTNAAADVAADPADPSTVLGRVEANTTYPLRSDANPDWYGVEYGGGTGWIRRGAGRACWEVRGL